MIQKIFDKKVAQKTLRNMSPKNKLPSAFTPLPNKVALSRKVQSMVSDELLASHQMGVTLGFYPILIMMIIFPFLGLRDSSFDNLCQMFKIGMLQSLNGVSLGHALSCIFMDRE